MHAVERLMLHTAVDCSRDESESESDRIVGRACAVLQGRYQGP